MTRALWCILGCRRELPLCAQVIFFPGVSGQGPAFLNACEWCGVGGKRIVSGDAPMSIWRAATLVSPLEEQWNTLQRCCVWSMFMSVLGQWGTALHNTRNGFWLREKRGGPSRHPWHSLIIKTRRRGEEKTDPLAVFTVARDCRKALWPLWVAGDSGAGVVWGWGVVEVQGDRTHCVGVLFDIKAC